MYVYNNISSARAVGTSYSACANVTRWVKILGWLRPWLAPTAKIIGDIPDFNELNVPKTQPRQNPVFSISYLKTEKMQVTQIIPHGRLGHAEPRSWSIPWLLLTGWSKESSADLVLLEYSGFSITRVNTLRPRQNERHLPDDIFKCIFLNENVSILIKISQKFVPKGPINNIPALVQIMAWRRSGDKPLSEPMVVSLLMHICFTRPQWVNSNTLSKAWTTWTKWSAFCTQNLQMSFL